MELLRALIERHGLRSVRYEGLKAETVTLYRELVDALKTFKATGESPFDEFLRGEHRIDMLRIGAPGRLLLSGELQAVLPAEDGVLLDAADPAEVGFDSPENEAREDAMVRNMVLGGPMIVVVLGGGHDLSDNVPEGCEYIRVTTRQYRDVVSR